MLADHLLPLMSHASMTVLQDTGHLSPLEVPDQVASHITTFTVQLKNFPHPDNRGRIMPRHSAVRVNTPHGPHVNRVKSVGRSRGLPVEHEHDFAFATPVALGEDQRVFPVLQRHGAIDACAQRAVGDQRHQIAIGVVHPRGVGAA